MAAAPRDPAGGLPDPAGDAEVSPVADAPGDTDATTLTGHAAVPNGSGPVVDVEVGATTAPDTAEDVGTAAEPDGAGDAADRAGASSEEERWEAFAPAPEPPPGRLRRVVAAVSRFLVHEWTVVVVGGFALAVLMTWPALRYPRYTLPKDLGDPSLVSWLLAWPGHQLVTDPVNLWHGNAFYPERWSYAFTDSLLGYAPAGLLGSGTADALLRYNLVFVFTHALAFIGAYALVRQLGAGRLGGLVAGLAFGFAPWRLAQAEHLHVISTGGIALALAMLARGHGWSLRHGYRPERARPGWIIAGWLVAGWQVTLGFGIGLPFVYALLLIAVGVAAGWLVRRVMRRPRQPVAPVVAAHVAGGTLFTVVAVLMALPYLIVLQQHPHARRAFEEVAFFSPPPVGLVTGASDSWLWGALHAGVRQEFTAPSEMALLPGFTLIALGLAGLVVSVWRWQGRLALAAGLAAAVVLSLGASVADGAVYRVLYEYLPGWAALRTPGRLVVWTTLLLAVLAAGAVTALAERARQAAVARGYDGPGVLLRSLVVLPLVLVLLESVGTVDHLVVPPPPAAMQQAEPPILVLPSDPVSDLRVMWWSTDGFPAVVNGASGFTPTSLAEVREVTASFPDAESVSYLRALGVETVIVLADEVVGTPWERALTASTDGLAVTRTQVDRAIVFDLNP